MVAVEVISATHREFGEAPVKAVQQWLFKPGIKDGRKVKFRLVQPFGFNLN